MTSSKSQRPASSKAPKGGKKPKAQRASKSVAPERRIPEARRKLFVEAYLATRSCVEAARQAGYKGDSVTLSATGSRLLGNADIKEAISKRIAALADKLGATELQIQLWHAASFDPSPYFTIEAVEEWFVPGAKPATVVTPKGAQMPDGCIKLREFERCVPDLAQAKREGALHVLRSASFFPDGSVKALSFEDRATARKELAKITKLLAPEQDPATALALALQQAFGAGVRQDGQARAAEWRANLSNEGG